jgi:D-sedoheptulose 7-phosphate isomerase
LAERPEVVMPNSTSPARDMGIVTVGLLGGDGGPALAHCDFAVVVPDTETARIQECHITLGHAVLTLMEDRLVS